MVTPEEKIGRFCNYCDKLVNIINTRQSFEIFGKVFIDKQIVDDVACCIDANIPYEFKKYREKYGNTDKRVSFFRVYMQMITFIRVKPPIGNSSYMIAKIPLIKTIEEIKNTIIQDYKYIMNKYPNIMD